MRIPGDRFKRGDALANRNGHFAMSVGSARPPMTGSMSGLRWQRLDARSGMDGLNH